MTLLTLADAKTHLNITVNTYDAELQSFIDAVTPLIERHIGGPAEVRSVTETVTPCDYWRALPLTYGPVVSVTSISINGIDQVISDVWVTEGRVLRRNYGIRFWPWINTPVVVTYQAGQDATALPTLSLAAKITVGHLWNTQRRAGAVRNANSDMAGGLTPGFAFAIPNAALEVLEPYRAVTGLA